MPPQRGWQQSVGHRQPRRRMARGGFVHLRGPCVGTNVRGDGALRVSPSVPASGRRGVAYGVVSLNVSEFLAHRRKRCRRQPGPGCRRGAWDWRPRRCVSRGMWLGRLRYVAQFAQELACAGAAGLTIAVSCRKFPWPGSASGALSRAASAPEMRASKRIASSQKARRAPVRGRNANCCKT